MREQHEQEAKTREDEAFAKQEAVKRKMLEEDEKRKAEVKCHVCTLAANGDWYPLLGFIT